MKKVCIDSSLAATWISYAKHTAAANLLRQEWAKNGVEFVSPPVFYPEVMGFLQQQVLSRGMLPEEADEAFSICLEIPIKIVGSEDVYRTAWQVSKEPDLNLSWAAQYLAVAELENCEFWTADRRLASLAQEKRTWVKWVGDYGRDPVGEVPTPKQVTTPTPDGAPKRYGTVELDDPGLWRKL